MLPPQVHADIRSSHLSLHSASLRETTLPSLQVPSSTLIENCHPVCLSRSHTISNLLPSLKMRMLLHLPLSGSLLLTGLWACPRPAVHPKLCHRTLVGGHLSLRKPHSLKTTSSPFLIHLTSLPSRSHSRERYLARQDSCTLTPTPYTPATLLLHKTTPNPHQPHCHTPQHPSPLTLSITHDSTVTLAAYPPATLARRALAASQWVVAPRASAWLPTVAEEGVVEHWRNTMRL